jgi:hypothetical protein
MSIKLNKEEESFNYRQKLNSINALNLILSPTKNYTQELYCYVKGVAQNFTGKTLYLDILPYYYGGSVTSLALNSGANNGKVQIVITSATISAIDLSECDCREFVIRAGSSELVSYGKLTVETYDDYTAPTPVVIPTNYHIHNGTEGSQFTITLADGVTYRNVNVIRSSDNQDITSGITVNCITNAIQIDLGVTDFACVVVYSVSNS